MSKYAVRAAMAGAVALLAVAGPAAAQAWLGQVVGEMAAEQAAAQREANCMKGIPADPSDVASSNRRADKLMESFFALTSHASKRDIAALFTKDKPGVTVTNEEAKLSLDALGPLLDEPAKHAKVLSVVGGDNQTMRAIWSAGEGETQVYYGIDIINGNWMRSSTIWHLTISKTMPDAPPAYCHIDPDQSY